MYIYYADYAAEDVFAIQVQYNWFGATKEDFTVKVYSRQELSIVDSDGNTNQIHMDGQ